MTRWAGVLSSGCEAERVPVRPTEILASPGYLTESVQERGKISYVCSTVCTSVSGTGQVWLGLLRIAHWLSINDPQSPTQRHQAPSLIHLSTTLTRSTSSALPGRQRTYEAGISSHPKSCPDPLTSHTCHCEYGCFHLNTAKRNTTSLIYES